MVRDFLFSEEIEKMQENENGNAGRTKRQWEATPARV
jgi:hypothetical protein